jgi:hypothetical protein
LGGDFDAAQAETVAVGVAFAGDDTAILAVEYAIERVFYCLSNSRLERKAAISG